MHPSISILCVHNNDFLHYFLLSMNFPFMDKLCFCISLKWSCLHFEWMKFKSDNSNKPCTINTIHLQTISHFDFIVVFHLLFWFIRFNWIYVKQQSKCVAESNKKTDAEQKIDSKFRFIWFGYILSTPNKQIQCSLWFLHFVWHRISTKNAE